MALRHLALPHASTEDDVYEGFFIPKGLLSWYLSSLVVFVDSRSVLSGTLVIGNAWCDNLNALIP